MDKIEFISYDGDYPNLCSGNLILKLDGNLASFKYCLTSGGDIDFDEKGEDVTIQGPWTFKVPLPEDFCNEEQYEREYARRVSPPFKITEDDRIRIEELVNIHIEQGCCGGCL